MCVGVCVRARALASPRVRLYVCVYVYVQLYLKLHESALWGCIGKYSRRRDETKSVCVAVCCTMCCSVLQCVAVCCSHSHDRDESRDKGIDGFLREGGGGLEEGGAVTERLI